MLEKDRWAGARKASFCQSVGMHSPWSTNHSFSGGTRNIRRLAFSGDDEHLGDAFLSPLRESLEGSSHRLDP